MIPLMNLDVILVQEVIAPKEFNFKTEESTILILQNYFRSTFSSKGKKNNKKINTRPNKILLLFYINLQKSLIQ